MKILMKPKILLLTALMTCSALTFAQTSGGSTAGTTGTSTAPSAGVNQPTTPIGVTPQTAAEANQKAIPRSDTGTVVRTSPNAADATRNATGTNNNSTSNNSTSNAAGTSGMNSTTGTNNASDTSGGTRGNGTVTAMRKARADRN